MSADPRCIKMAREKITCLLCRGLIAFKDRNQTRFLDHMKEEHNVRFDFDVLLVATLLSEAEKVDLVGKNKEKFEPRNAPTKSENVETYVIGDEEKITDSFIKCKFCDLKVSSKLDLKNHMVNVHRKADNEDKKIANNLDAKSDQTNDKMVNIHSKADNANDKVIVETKTAIPAPKESIEGVLKCKTCGKYIKQSIMAEHKAKHIENENEERGKPTKENADGKSKTKIKEAWITKAPQKPEETKNIKASESNPAKSVAPKKVEPSRLGKRKTLADKEWEEEDNDDSADEDFEPNMEKVEAKQEPCRYFSKKFGRFCSKKFSSKVRLLSHMRVSHDKAPGQ